MQGNTNGFPLIDNKKGFSITRRSDEFKLKPRFSFNEPSSPGNQTAPIYRKAPNMKKEILSRDSLSQLPSVVHNNDFKCKWIHIFMYLDPTEVHEGLLLEIRETLRRSRKERRVH